MSERTMEERCGCRACLNQREAHLPAWEQTARTMMIVCPQCQNKRCPHADDHRHECTAPALATPEPGGEARTALIRETAHCAVQRVATLANMREPDGGYWLWEMRSEVVDWVVGEMKEDNKGEAWKPIKGATPAASEDVRERVIAELERTAEVWQSPHKGDDNPLSDLLREAAALLRTPRGEGEAALVEAVLRRWNRLAADVEGSEGPLTETELVGIARDVAAALRSEAQGEVEAKALWALTTDSHEAKALVLTMILRHWSQELLTSLHHALRSEVQGEGWQVTEPARDIVRREMPETRATVREAIRAARRGEGGE